MSSTVDDAEEQRALTPASWQAHAMADTEWEELVENVRARLSDHLKPKGTVDQGAFGKAAGVSRPHIANFIAGRKTPTHAMMGRIVQALGLRIIEVAKGLAPSQAIIGSIGATGIVLFHQEARMGRFILIEGVADHERPLPEGAILVSEPTTAPVPDKWNFVRVDESVRLARAYKTPNGFMLRFAGERVRQEYTPEVHKLEGFAAWEMYPAE